MAKQDSTLISATALAEGILPARLQSISMPDFTQGHFSFGTDWLIYTNSILASWNIAKLGSNAPGGSQFGLDASQTAATGTRFKAGIAGICGVDYVGANILALTDGATVTPNFAAQSFIWKLSAAGSRTIAAPTNLPAAGGGTSNNFFVIFDLLNNTAGAIVTTFNAIYKVAWTDPAAGKRRTMILYYDGANLVQVGAVSADL